MGLNKDFNQPPYYDDFSVDKNFHRILFKPAYAVQARELTQLQTILQNQIERFGENILKEGAIVRGGNFTESNEIGYAKIMDLMTNGQQVSMNSYKNLYASGSVSGVVGKVILTATGLQSQTPDLNTLYVKYLKTSTKTGQVGKKVFDAGEIIDLYTDEALTNLVYSVTVAPTSVDASPVGYAYMVSCGEGVIFQKGNFVRFAPQSIIVSKYNQTPDAVVVGFKTEELIVNSNNDTSLLDNANGFNNFKAPGADRLQLIPKLVVLDKSLTDADETFFAIQEYEKGRIIRRNETTKFNSINDVLKKRTYEESGNYSVNPIKVWAAENTANTELMDIYAGEGVSYVGGQRVETFGALSVSVPKATTYETAPQQDVLGNYGNYLILEKYFGEFDFTTNQTVTLYDAAQNATSIASFTPTGTAIGTGFVRAVTNDTTNGQVRVYLHNVKMNTGQNFRDARAIYNPNGNKGVGDIVLSGGDAKFVDANFKKLIFPVGKSAIRSIETSGTDYVARTSRTGVVASATGQVTISLSGSDLFPYGASTTLTSDNRREVMLISQATSAPYTKGEVIDLSGATVTIDASGQQMTISLASNPAADMNVIAYVNVKKVNVSPIGKDLETIYVKVDTTTNEANTTGVYSLGVPDVHSIELVTANTSANTYSESYTDVTKDFVLNRNTNDGYYGISYVRKKRAMTIAANTRFLFKLKVFKKNTSSPYSQSYYTVNSYPIDDANTANTAAIQTEDIPVYKRNTADAIDLRDAIDFRPYAANSVVYATTIASASVSDNSIATERSNLSFGSAPLNLIAPNEVVEVAYSYYLPRQDRFVIDNQGDFAVIQGKPATEPALPNAPQNSMTLANIYMPPFPSLSPQAAAKAGRGSTEDVVTIARQNHRRYTMRDIGAIEKRIDRIEYYSALNSLEKSASDMVVTDANGLDRFKNGILVDNFNDMKVTNIADGLFSASIKQGSGELAPSFRKYNMGVKPIPSTEVNVTDHGGQVYTLTSDKAVATSQIFATSYRNCTQDFYSYNGTGRIHPEYDSAADVVKAPDTIIDIDVTQGFVDFTESLGEFIDLTREDVVETGSDTSVSRTRDRQSQTRTTTTLVTTETTTTSLDIGSTTSTKKVGDFITDLSFNPFLRGRQVHIEVFGLRPNTRHYFFFDGDDVSDLILNAEKIGPDDPSWWKLLRRSGSVGDPVVTDQYGTLRAIFNLPANTYYVGDRLLEIADVDNLASLVASTSSVSLTYSGFNYSVTTNSLEISTRMPTFDVISDTTSETTETVTTVTTPRPRRDEPRDPISQTFLVSRGMSDDSIIMVDSVDLFFKSKSSTRGVSIELRPTVNGYPGVGALPFGKVHLSPNDVNVSDDGTIATNVTFPAPVPLKVGQTYCITVKPDAADPDYLIWIAKTGEADLATDVRVTQDANPSGILFTSTNDQVWTPYQDENMKMTLYKSDFTATSGSVELTNEDSEFLTLSEYTKDFQRGERVYVGNTVVAAQTIAVDANTLIFSGTSTTFTSTFVVGEHIVIANGADRQVFEITSITNDTELTVDEYPATSNNVAGYFRTVSGEVDYFNGREPIRLIIEKSSAKAGLTYAANSIVYGADSGAAGTILSVDDLPISYMKTNMYRLNTIKSSNELSATYLSNGSGNYLTSDLDVPFDKPTLFNSTETYIRSKSNNLGGNSFKLKMDLQSSSRNVSPFFDYDISSVDLYEYFINNDITDEDTNVEGASKCRYISKTATLAEGLDADDIKVWLTSYRPAGTDVHVYAKFKSADDVTEFDDLPWTKLEMNNNTNFTSSSANLNDFREFEYSIPTGTAVAGGRAYIDPTTSSIKYISSDGAVHTDYKEFAIKIILTSSVGQQRIPRVKDMRALSLSA